MTAEEIKREMMQTFGDAYRGLGLNRQMGNIVALLIYAPEPMSLDEITQQLGMSKGPVSQLVRRLYEHNIIRKVWNPGSRKDYYEVKPEMFANAFKNFAARMHYNIQVARHIHEQIAAAPENTVPMVFEKRVEEMERFYCLMEKHFTAFLEEWTKERAELFSVNPAGR